MRALRFLVVIFALATGEGIRAQTMPPAPTLTGVISGVVRDVATPVPPTPDTNACRSSTPM